MYALNEQLARVLMEERLADAQGRQRAREARRTRPAAKKPTPSGRRSQGMLARLIPWAGVQARTA
jgi:hypothetical protein